MNMLSVDNLMQYKQEDVDLPSQRFTRQKEVEINHIHNDKCDSSNCWDYSEKPMPKQKTIEITTEDMR